MLHERSRLEVRHGIESLESLDQVAAARAQVRHVHRGVAMQASPRLLRDLLSFGELLVLQHVGMTTLLAKILRECVASPELTKTRILLKS